LSVIVARIRKPGENVEVKNEYKVAKITPIKIYTEFRYGATSIGGLISLSEVGPWSR
jgi:hypothetical protein